MKLVRPLAVKVCPSPCPVTARHDEIGVFAVGQKSGCPWHRRRAAPAFYVELTDDERSLVDQIEVLRRRLNSTSATVRIVDYGAGDAKLERSADGMRHGMSSQCSVSSACRASKRQFWALFLFHLIRHFQPRSCVELGSCVGISAAYQAAALRLNGRGNLITLEGAPALAEIARKNLQELGLDRARVINGRFEDELPRVLANSTPVDYAFIDGHHDEQATIRYFQQFLSHLSPQAIVVFDDLSWSAGMRRAPGSDHGARSSTSGGRSRHGGHSALLDVRPRQAAFQNRHDLVRGVPPG